jgi:hypothetical protein
MTAALLTMCGLAAAPGQVMPSAIAPPDATMPVPAPVVAGPDVPTPAIADPNKPILLPSRTAVIDIDYDPATRKTIQRTLLYVSRDLGQTWGLEATAMPDQESLTFTTKEDGIFWLTIQTVFMNGIKTPADVTRSAPDRKLFLDGTSPTVRIVKAQRVGDEVAVEWTVEEKFPNDKATVVRYRAADQPQSAWIAAGYAGGQRSVSFKPAVSGHLTVEVICRDEVGNAGTGKADVGVLTAVSGTQPAAAGNGPPVKPIAATADPIAVPAMLPTPSATASATPSPLPTPTASTPAGAAPLAVPGIEPVPVPVAVNSTDRAESNTIPTRTINITRFDLAYSLTAGPAGVNGIDLWVTRDDGRTWRKWSRHDGRETPLKVVLDTRENPQVEGTYGFKLVPESGSRLADSAPTAGTPPEFKVTVDVTAPAVQVYEPSPHPDRPDAVVIRWKASDANFGKDPIVIEYAEQPTGPWKAVNASDMVPVVGGATPAVPRLANTGEYGWRLPGDLTVPRVYLKFTAVDLAGNRTEAMTRDPILVDLTKPRAKIQGIVGLGN